MTGTGVGAGPVFRCKWMGGQYRDGNAANTASFISYPDHDKGISARRNLALKGIDWAKKFLLNVQPFHAPEGGVGWGIFVSLCC